MAAPFNDLTSKVEESLKSVVDALSLLDSASASVPCFTGTDDDDHQTPCVLVHAMQSNEEPLDTGNFHFKCLIHVQTRIGGDSGETLAQHRTRCAKVFDEFIASDANSTLSAAVSDFYVYDVTNEGFSSSQADSTVVNTLQIDVLACASDIS